MNLGERFSSNSPAAQKPFFRWLAAAVLALQILIAPDRAIAQRPLGIDVSDYQGSINWTSVKGAGISFAWAKATEGTGTGQSTFTANEANAAAAGVYIGAYHYA